MLLKSYDSGRTMQRVGPVSMVADSRFQAWFRFQNAQRFNVYVFDRAGGSILVTISAHLSLNIAMAIGGASFSSRLYWGGLAAIFGVLAIVITLRLRAAAPRNEGYVSEVTCVQRSPAGVN